jgi:hypothetical protein
MQATLLLLVYPVRALSCAEKVVDDAGHPTPGPNKFCRDEMAVWIRAICEPVELSVGNGAGTPGLWTSCPAATLAESDAMNEFRSGGQEQGILMLLIPMQLPAPSGL